MAHGGNPARTGASKTKRSVGAYGSTRGKERQRRRRDNRERDPRYKEAMQAVKAAQDQLDRIMAAQAENPALGETPGAIYARRQAELELQTAKVIEDEYANKELAKEPKLKVVPPVHMQRLVEADVVRVYVKQTHTIDTKELPQHGDGKWQFSYQTARIMLKEGYNIKHVISYTGIGYEDLKDIPLDDEGYYEEGTEVKEA